MKNYQIVRSDDPDVLEIKVNDLICQGWVIVGGIAIGPGKGWLYQAMVKGDSLANYLQLAPTR